MKQAKIFDIKHFAVHDGSGIRTTVFLKGCPLKCVWCHNPEGIAFETQIGYVKKRCINCGECVKICDANTFDKEHIFDRNKCTVCKKCVDVCLGGAFQLHGRIMNSAEVFDEVCADRKFYDNTGGGVTLSGGECLMQPEFCIELLDMCKSAGINTAVDTCGYVPKEIIHNVSAYTDMFLYDIKAIDEDVHMRCTGRSNKLILDNLRYINELGIKTEVRIPFVPEYNDGEIEKIAKFLEGIHCISAVKLLAYHNMAGTKYEAIGLENTMPKNMPTTDQMKEAANKLRKTGLKVLM